MFGKNNEDDASVEEMSEHMKKLHNNIHRNMQIVNAKDKAVNSLNRFAKFASEKISKAGEKLDDKLKEHGF